MRPLPTTRPLLAALFATALLLGAAGCGDDDEPEATGAGDTSDTTASTQDGGGPDYGGTSGGETDGDAPDNAIVAKDFKFSELTVGAGEEIVLQNEDGAQHTATADDGSFDLAADGGATSDPGTAPEEPGSYPYHCEIHPTMTATLTVEG
jgi:plastocyanin